MSPNGKNIHPVSPREERFGKGNAEWSPDGTQIAYFTWKDNKVWAGTLMLATRVRAKRWKHKRVALPLPEGFLLDTLCWSPDGKHLLFGGGPQVNRRNFYDIYRYTFETKEIVQLVDHPARIDFSPDWSVHALSVSLEGNVATYWGQIKAAGR